MSSIHDTRRHRKSAAISLLYRDRTGLVDGIGDYCDRLEVALRAAGADATTVTWRARRIRVEEGSVILQYNPFAFGRWGFAPRLPFELISLRRRCPGILQAVMVHETFVSAKSAKSLVISVWQRLQLRAILSTADVVMVSTSSWIPLLPAGRETVTVPVGSNLPDRRERRQDQRRVLGADDGTLVLATFGTDHPSRLMGYVAAAANKIAGLGHPVLLLCLGVGTPTIDGLDPSVAVRCPGRQSEDELATELSAADLYLAAFADGLSTRRTTLMAALQHALAVIGTDGRLTEPDLRREHVAIRWTPAGDSRQFAEAALALAGDPELRQRHGEAARALYDRRFSWDVIASTLLGVLSRQRPM